MILTNVQTCALSSVLIITDMPLKIEHISKKYRLDIDLNFCIVINEFGIENSLF